MINGKYEIGDEVLIRAVVTDVVGSNVTVQVPYRTDYNNEMNVHATELIKSPPPLRLCVLIKLFFKAITKRSKKDDTRGDITDPVSGAAR